MPHVIAVDVARLPGTDVAARVEQLPFADGSVDLVFATGLLEHVLDERPVLDEIARVLRPGGRVHVELPFLQHYHDDPIDSRRYTGPGLVRLLEQHGFAPESSGCHIGPTVGLLMMLSYYAQLLVEGPGRPRRLLANAAFLAVRFVGWPLKFLDDWLVKKPSAHGWPAASTARRASPRRHLRPPFRPAPGGRSLSPADTVAATPLAPAPPLRFNAPSTVPGAVDGWQRQQGGPHRESRARPGGPLHPEQPEDRAPQPRHLGALEGPRQRRDQGAHRVAPGGDLQREPRQGRREVPEQGPTVYIEGTLQTRKWTDQSGQERYTTEVVVPRFRGELVLLGGGAAAARSRAATLPGDDYGAEPAPAGPTRGGPRGAPPLAAPPRPIVDELDDDIPFARPEEGAHHRALALPTASSHRSSERRPRAASL